MIYFNVQYLSFPQSKSKRHARSERRLSPDTKFYSLAAVMPFRITENLSGSISFFPLDKMDLLPEVSRADRRYRASEKNGMTRCTDDELCKGMLPI